MNKKNLVLKVVLSVVCVAILGVVIYFGSKAFASKSDGQIQVVYVDVKGNTISDELIKFNEGDTLVKLLQDNYDNVTIENGMIMTFEDYVTPADWSSYICIYVND